MSQSAHTFTPKDDSLVERMNAYIRVQQDYESLKLNIDSMEVDTLGNTNMLFFADVEKEFDIPNTSLRIEITRRDKRSTGVIADNSFSDEVIKYALEQVLESLKSKEK